MLDKYRSLDPDDAHVRCSVTTLEVSLGELMNTRVRTRKDIVLPGTRVFPLNLCILPTRPNSFRTRVGGAKVLQWLPNFGARYLLVYALILESLGRFYFKNLAERFFFKLNNMKNSLKIYLQINQKSILNTML